MKENEIKMLLIITVIYLSKHLSKKVKKNGSIVKKTVGKYDLKTTI